MNLDAYRKRKDRFMKAKQFVTGHESEVFSKLVKILNKSGNQELVFGSYHLKYTFSEIREEGKKDLAVIEDIPDESADLASMSFDITDDSGNMICEAVFHKNMVETVPAVNQNHIDLIIQSVLDSAIR